MRQRCPACGRFLRDVVAWVNGNGDIRRVEGACSTHGRQAVTNYDYVVIGWIARCRSGPNSSSPPSNAVLVPVQLRPVIAFLA